MVASLYSPVSRRLFCEEDMLATWFPLGHVLGLGCLGAVCLIIVFLKVEGDSGSDSGREDVQ